jgi:hypothetical protein
MKKIIVLLLCLLISACSAPNQTQQILSNEGYVNVEILGLAFIGCTQSEIYRTSFVADTHDNRHVRGSVCVTYTGEYRVVEIEQMLER